MTSIEDYSAHDKTTSDYIDGRFERAVFSKFGFVNAQRVAVACRAWYATVLIPELSPLHTGQMALLLRRNKKQASTSVATQVHF